MSKACLARTAREPRTVITEFGLPLGGDVQIRVHDSNADMRYMILPKRPKRAEDVSREELAALITRDHLIGVAVPSS